MQVQNGMEAKVVTSSGKATVHVGTTPNWDALVIDKGGKGSVEYAKGRAAINADFHLNYKHNQALAKRLRKQCKIILVEELGGKVSTKMVEGKDGKQEKKLLVTFTDHTVANL